MHGKWYNIILEYADQGTLEDFMKTKEPPSSLEDGLLVWDRIFDITHGIAFIHGQIKDGGSASQMFHGYVLCSIWHISLLMSW